MNSHRRGADTQHKIAHLFHDLSQLEYNPPACISAKQSFNQSFTIFWIVSFLNILPNGPCKAKVINIEDVGE